MVCKTHFKNYGSTALFKYNDENSTDLSERTYTRLSSHNYSKSG